MLQIDQGGTGISCLHRLHHWCMLCSGRSRIFLRGAPTTKVGVLAYFLPKNAWKWKNLDPGYVALGFYVWFSNALHDGNLSYVNRRTRKFHTSGWSRISQVGWWTNPKMEDGKLLLGQSWKSWKLHENETDWAGNPFLEPNSPISTSTYCTIKLNANG